MFPRSYLSHPRSVAAARVFSAALIALLLAAMLLPLAPTVGAADDDDPIIRLPGGSLDGPVRIVDREESVGDDAPVIDGPILIEQEEDFPVIDGPILVPSPTPEIDIDQDTPVQVGGIAITKFACPSGLDAYNLTIYDLSLNCQEPLDGITFVASDGDQNVANGPTGLHGPGLIELSNLPPGAYSVVEQVPAGYGEPIVFCQNAADPVGSSVQMLVTDGNQIFHVFQAGEYLSCLWYNVPGPSDEPVYVTINKYLCPRDADAYADDHDALGAACDKPLADVEFRHDAAGDFQTATTDIGGQVFFTQQTAGDSTLTETLPANFGEPIVYCTIVGPIGPTYDRYETVAGSFTTTLDAGDQLVCDWYNVPLYPIGDAQVTIVKHECQPDYPDVYSYDPDGLIAVCDAYQDGVDFTVSDGGPVNLTRATGADGAGAAVFNYLDSGEYTITETVPAGFGEPIVWCAMGVVGGEEPEEYARYDLEAAGPAVFSVLVNDDALYCHWFNVPGAFEGEDDPTGGDGSILVRKFACPDGFNGYGATYFDLAFTCQTPMNDIPFLLSDGGQLVLSGATGDFGEGAVEFAGLPTSGAYSIVEHVPDGYGEPVVYCKDPIAPNGDWAPSTVADGNQILEILDAGHVLMCDWFNIPTETDGTIEVVKYWCDGYVYDAAHCEIYTAGQDFTLFAPGGGDPVNFTTGPDGRYVVQAGPTLWSLGEGDGGWCHVTSNRTHQPQPLPNPGFDGTSLLVEVVAGETTTIEVFNCDPWTQDDPGGDDDEWDNGTPIGSGDPGEVKSLPNTGAGLTVSANGIGGVIAAVQLASLLLVAAVAVRRRRSQR